MNNITIGNYFYNKNPIDKGNFSLIFKGYSLTNNIPVAIKKNIINNNIQIKNEINILKKLNHQNIVTLLDNYVINKQYYFIMEYCNNGNLKKYIDSCISENDLKFMYEIIHGLHYLINKKIIHRDIKPTNIFIHNDTIKIGDFGFSKEITENLHNTFCGSPLYMAPEVLKYEKYDSKADMWSLGITLYELLYKNHPFFDKNLSNNELIKKIISDKNINIPKYENDLHLIIKNILIKDKKYRIEWNDLFKNDWYNNYKIVDEFELSFNEIFQENNKNSENINIDYQENFLIKSVNKDKNNIDNYNILSDASSSFNNESMSDLLFKSAKHFFSL